MAKSKLEKALHKRITKTVDRRFDERLEQLREELRPDPTDPLIDELEWDPIFELMQAVGAPIIQEEFEAASIPEELYATLGFKEITILEEPVSSDEIEQFLSDSDDLPLTDRIILKTTLALRAKLEGDLSTEVTERLAASGLCYGSSEQTAMLLTPKTYLGVCCSSINWLGMGVDCCVGQCSPARNSNC